MIKLIPTIATLTNVGECKTSKDGKLYNKISIAIGSDYYWVAVFGQTAQFLSDYASVGAKLFLEEWNLKKNENYYDFTATRVQIVKNGRDS